MGFFGKEKYSFGGTELCNFLPLTHTQAAEVMFLPRVTFCHALCAVVKRLLTTLSDSLMEFIFFSFFIFFYIFLLERRL